MKDVIVIGGGLAGLSAAVQLALRGTAVTILESRNRLGGRAGSFTDPATGQLVDACQHVSMGCCSAFADFCRIVGIDRFLETQPTLYFMTPDRRVSRFAPDPLPSPFHLSRSFAKAHYLSLDDKWRIGRGLLAIRRVPPETDGPLLPWLMRHGQTESTIRRFWSIVLVSALNETVDRVGLKYARKVFVDAFLSGRGGFEVQIPTVPLGRLYGEELDRWLTEHRVRVELNAGVKQIATDGNRVRHLELRDGTTRRADGYVLAVPWTRVGEMIAIPGEPIAPLQPSPITSFHFWFDRSITELPHVVFIDCRSQWLFNRGEVSPGMHYVQIVVSASREFQEMGHESAQAIVLKELTQLFPIIAQANLLRSKVITEHTATFVTVPGVDAIRPGQRTAFANLALAGDWTQTGWPATMEGAVRSGNLAAGILAAGNPG
jgi:squalene-associated FAD-dependent desaturase